MVQGGGSANEHESLGSARDSILKSGLAADGSTGDELGSTNVVAILSSESEGKLVRRSKRGASSADTDSMTKAMKRTASRNLDNEGQSTVLTDHASFSVSNSLANHAVISVNNSLAAVGVVLGSSAETVSASVSLTEHVESLTDKPISTVCGLDNSVDEEAELDFLSPLNRLCGDLTDDFYEGRRSRCSSI